MITLMRHVMKLNDAIQTEYQSAYDLAQKNTWSNGVASEINGNGIHEIREFLVEDIKLRVGEGVEYSDLRTHAMTVSHRKAAGGFKVADRDFVSGGAIQFKVDYARGLGVKSAMLGQELLLSLINGANTKSYDGLNFFATGHYNNYTDGSQGTYDNAETGKSLTVDNLAAAIAKIEDRQMADGTNRYLRAKWLLHPPALKKAAYEATGASFISATDNVLAKKSTYDVTPVTVPGLAKVGGKDVWIVLAELDGGGTFGKAFGISTLVPTSITNYDGLTVPELKRAQGLEYIAAGDLAAFVGHPYLAHRCAVA